MEIFDRALRQAPERLKPDAMLWLAKAQLERGSREPAHRILEALARQYKDTPAGIEAARLLTGR